MYLFVYLFLPKTLREEVLLEPPPIEAKKHINHILFLNYSFPVTGMYKLTLDNSGKPFSIKIRVHILAGNF